MRNNARFHGSMLQYIQAGDVSGVDMFSLILSTNEIRYYLISAGAAALPNTVNSTIPRGLFPVRGQSVIVRRT